MLSAVFILHGKYLSNSFHLSNLVWGTQVHVHTFSFVVLFPCPYCVIDLSLLVKSSVIQHDSSLHSSGPYPYSSIILYLIICIIFPHFIARRTRLFFMPKLFTFIWPIISLLHLFVWYKYHRLPHTRPVGCEQCWHVPQKTSVLQFISSDLINRD